MTLIWFGCSLRWLNFQVVMLFYWGNLILGEDNEEISQGAAIGWMSERWYVVASEDWCYSGGKARFVGACNVAQQKRAHSGMVSVVCVLKILINSKLYLLFQKIKRYGLAEFTVTAILPKVNLHKGEHKGIKIYCREYILSPWKREINWKFIHESEVNALSIISVSYTHLTLLTKRIV